MSRAPSRPAGQGAVFPPLQTGKAQGRVYGCGAGLDDNHSSRRLLRACQPAHPGQLTAETPPPPALNGMMGGMGTGGLAREIPIRGH